MTFQAKSKAHRIKMKNQNGFRLSSEMKHPILLLYQNHVTNLIISSVHKQLGHVGRNHVLASL